MTFALVLCGACGRPRLIDRSVSSSTCPHCGCSEKTSRIRICMESTDQNEIRAALANATSGNEIEGLKKDAEEKRRKIREDDPLSSLAYRYEQSSDMDERMEVMSEGLSRIKGEFTVEDMMEIDPKRAEKMLPAMLARGYIYEARPGCYRVRFNPSDPVSFSLPCAGPREPSSEAFCTSHSSSS